MPRPSWRRSARRHRRDNWKRLHRISTLLQGRNRRLSCSQPRCDCALPLEFAPIDPTTALRLRNGLNERAASSMPRCPFLPCLPCVQRVPRIHIPHHHRAPLEPSWPRRCMRADTALWVIGGHANAYIPCAVQRVTRRQVRRPDCWCQRAQQQGGNVGAFGGHGYLPAGRAAPPIISSTSSMWKQSARQATSGRPPVSGTRVPLQ